MQQAKVNILLTGGGTGGHVFPAIAIADAIRKKNPDAGILFVGANGKMEMDRVPRAGYAIEGLNIAGFQRGLSWHNLRMNLVLPFKLIKSSLRARDIIKSFQPDVVVGTGGYASGPVMRAAQQMGIPTVIQEQNSLPGITNRVLGRKASAICVAYEGMDRYFPAEKIVFTGNPVRTDISRMSQDKSAAKERLGLAPNRKTVLIVGGSLGARTLNRTMRAGHDLVQSWNDVQFIWQCGRFYHAEYSNCTTAQLPNVHLTPFIEQVNDAYAAADLIIARAGALTISELCLVGKPCILVPSPNVAEDHQTKNALALVQVGAARLVRDADAETRLLPEARLVLDNEALAFGLGENIRSLGKPGAADAIAAAVLQLLNRKNANETQ